MMRLGNSMPMSRKRAKMTTVVTTPAAIDIQIGRTPKAYVATATKIGVTSRNSVYQVTVKYK